MAVVGMVTSLRPRELARVRFSLVVGVERSKGSCSSASLVMKLVRSSMVLDTGVAAMVKDDVLQVSGLSTDDDEQEVDDEGDGRAPSPAGSP